MLSDRAHEAATLLETHPELSVFASYTDSELCDSRQLIGFERSLEKTSSLRNTIKQGIFIAESRKVIDRALAQDYQPFAGIMDSSWLNQNCDLVDYLKQSYPAVPFAIVNTQILQALTGYRTTKGPLMAFYRKPLPNPRDLLACSNHIAIFENINNYTNMGALFRSAAALHIDAVFITPQCYDPLYRRGLRVSMGAALQVPWTRILNGENIGQQKCEIQQKCGVRQMPEDNMCSWTESFFPVLHDFGFTTYALALTDTAYALDDPALPKNSKCALILGNEGTGLLPSTIEQSDYAVIIPMAHSVDSLNVACASSVAFWEFTRNRSS